jgi:3-oxoacyl-[acyl-carrier-protein] synthase-3
MSCYIIGCGAALPERIVTNAELAPQLGVTPEWIAAKSGIRERRWVQAEQSASDLAAMAVRHALADANITAAEIDYLIGGTLSPDYQTPGIAPLVQRKVAGCGQVPAVDLRVGCATILYSLQIARALIASHTAETIVCFGAEAQSKGLDLNERSAELSMLFGDGAGAMVVSCRSSCAHNDFALSIDDVLIATDGNFAEDLGVRAPGTGNGARWFEARHVEENLHHAAMNGRSVILHAVRKLAEAATEIMRRNEITPDQIDVMIPHQANANLLRSLSAQLQLPENRIVSNVARYGNTSGASAFIALNQARREGRLRAGAKVLFLAFGAGFTWGAALGQVCE